MFGKPHKIGMNLSNLGDFIQTEMLEGLHSLRLLRNVFTGTFPFFRSAFQQRKG